MQNLKEKKESFWETVKFIIIAIAIVVPIRIFIIQPFVVSGSSMYPTFESGQYLIVDEISYKMQEPKRDEVVIFRYPKDPSKFFIKRIIGLPNETIDINGKDIKITNTENENGFILNEPFLEHKIENSPIHYKLASDEYFVMGDNRSASSDSRYWGPVKRNLIIGRAFLRLFPFNKINYKPGAYEIK